MKATILTNKKPANKKQITQIIEKLSSNDLGEIEPYTIGRNNKFIEELLTLGNRYCNLKYRSVELYSAPSILLLNGSSGLHDDPGLGLILNWVLRVNQITNRLYCQFPTQLITKSGALDLTEGDVFLFDANKDHAWLSNHKCLLAQVAVYKGRSKKNTTSTLLLKKNETV